VEIINNERDAMNFGELREYPVDHRRRVEVGAVAAGSARPTMAEA
jgi:hypothetical protein